MQHFDHIKTRGISHAPNMHHFDPHKPKYGSCEKHNIKTYIIGPRRVTH